MDLCKGEFFTQFIAIIDGYDVLELVTSTQPTNNKQQTTNN
jgi:hypothetical protein